MKQTETEKDPTLKESKRTVPRPKNGQSKGMILDGHTGTVPSVKSLSSGEIRVGVKLRLGCI